MEDKSIVELFWARSEEAISEASSKYSAYCKRLRIIFCGTHRIPRSV